MEARRLAALPMPGAATRPAGLPDPASLRRLPAGRLTEFEVKSLAASYGVPVWRGTAVRRYRRGAPRGGGDRLSRGTQTRMP